MEEDMKLHFGGSSLSGLLTTIAFIAFGYCQNLHIQNQKYVDSKPEYHNR